MRKNVTNISTTRSKDAYDNVANSIADKYSDYSIVVDGGSYRFYNVSFEIDHQAKTIKLDYYLPMYTNFKGCNKWVLSEIAKGKTSGIAGLGMRRSVMALMGNTNVPVFDDFGNGAYWVHNKQDMKNYIEARTNTH